MEIDIDHLSEAELVDLNRRVVARLRLLAQVRAHAEMLAFKVGERLGAGGRPQGVDLEQQDAGGEVLRHPMAQREAALRRRGLARRGRELV